MLEFNAYKTYYSFASKEKAPKPKYVQKKADPNTSSNQKHVQATKGTRLKSKAKVAKLDKKKQPAKKPKAKGLAILSEVALTKAEQLKLASKRNKRQFHSSHASGSGVLDIPIYKSKSKKESWGDSEDDENNSDDLSDEGDDDNDGNDGDDNDANDDDKQEGDDTNDDDEETMYNDKDDEGGIDQQNASQQSRLQQEEEDAHAPPTPTPITFEATTAIPPLPDFASVFKFNERVTNLEKDISEMKQVNQYAQALSSILTIMDRYMDNKLGEAINKAIQAHNFDCREESQAEKREYIELSSYEAAATLFKFELIKILIDKMEKNKSFDVADYKRDLYDALVKSYNTEKDIFESYGELFSLKRSQDERDKDRDLSVGPNRGTKRRKSSKDVESSRDSRLKENKSSSASKDASQYRHKSSGKSAQAEEPIHTVKTQASNKIKSSS
ncbi:hypothetical protein Tco_0292151 [Tanacetum coccineum]